MPDAVPAPLRSSAALRGALATLLADPRWEKGVTALIIINAVTLGLETSTTATAAAGGFLRIIDTLILAIFVIELAIRIVVHRLTFFRDGWNVFDFSVVAIALIPAAGPFSVLRALRVLRLLRLITVMPSLKRVVGALIGALPGMGSIALLLTLLLYVASVMATKLFGAIDPEKFGTIGASAYTLFQLMTLDGWSGEVVRPVMREAPLAWLFFIPFILVTAFLMLNLFIGIVVNAMQEEHEAGRAEDARERERRADREAAMAQAALMDEIRALRADVAALRAGQEHRPVSENASTV